MNVWTAWFLAWVIAGLAVLVVITGGQPRQNGRRKAKTAAIAGWLLFSAFAAEITRLYLTVYPLPAWTCALGALGIAILGAITGLATGWFIGGHVVSRTTDLASGALGALITAWVEITSSYNHAEYVFAIMLVGAAFATFAFRMLSRPRVPQVRSSLLQ
jgi:hypothetical protein